MKIQIFCAINIVSTGKGTDVSDKRVLGRQEPEDGGSTLFRNVSNYLQGDATLTTQITWFFKQLQFVSQSVNQRGRQLVIHSASLSVTSFRCMTTPYHCFARHHLPSTSACALPMF
jgi:hypothetical protein